MRELSFSRKRQFVMVFLLFLLLGACFKVMVLVEAFTEVRPVNAVPVVSGLCFGGIGALACAFGNLAADFFGTLEPSSVLGFIGNFLAAWLPYKLWYLYFPEAPEVHSHRKLLCYLWISFVAALAVAWMIGSGIWLIFGAWIPNIALYIFLNDMVFPVIFGLPVFSVLTSDSVNLRRAEAPRMLLPIPIRVRRVCVVVDTLLLLVVVGMTHMGGDALRLPSALLSAPILLLTLVLAV